MPGLVQDGDYDRKRKRLATSPATGLKPRKAPKKTTSDDTQARILGLEEQILESQEHYNNIVQLQKYVAEFNNEPQLAILAAVALCRVFSRLIAAEKLVRPKTASEAELEVVNWLRTRLRDYRDSLLDWIGSPDATQESTALTLLMRIVKEETSGDHQRSTLAWRSKQGTFVSLVAALVIKDEAEGARQEFVEKYVEEHDDVRFYTYAAVAHCASADQTAKERGVGNIVEILVQIEGIPESQDQLEDWYGVSPDSKKHTLLSLSAHRKVAREAWLAVFRSPITTEQKKQILNVTTTQILPWFADYLELLVDFLTDAFNEGGSTSLLALSGIFDVMTKRNVDYPEFYMKLYSLLDEDLLQSKHRSRFFRLFSIFLESSHLPAAMVASFMKRLARLALQAPPGAIVWIIPWTYNTMKEHPQYTFMLHRVYHPAHSIYASNPKFKDEGIDDPFDMAEKDPNHTGAIDSSLWELETLRHHYHPNVATLAKILGEQFTKRDYQLEDFLDHSYASLIDAELGKEMKKTPVVEWDIPKQIVTTAESELNPLGSLLQKALDAL